MQLWDMWIVETPSGIFLLVLIEFFLLVLLDKLKSWWILNPVLKLFCETKIVFFYVPG